MTGQNLNNAKSYFYLFFKTTKIGKDHPRNPEKVVVDFGKNDKEIFCARTMIACEFLVKSTVTRSETISGALISCRCLAPR